MKLKKMKSHLIIVFASLATCFHLSSCNANEQAPKSALRNGDIIFHASTSEQSKAIQLATGSSYSHCGIIYIESGKTYVVEAVQPVKKTPFEKFVARGERGEYVVKRMRNAEAILTDEVLKAMMKEGEKFMGKSYDMQFDWSDDKIYCSELVWKVYKRAAGVELGTLRKMKDFNFNNPVVKEIVKSRYGDQIPWEESVISPSDIFESEELVTVGNS
jgi:uncharacterized protein YycO